MNRLEPGLARINIKNLRLRTFIGINDEELRKQQDLILNIRIHYRVDGALQHDDIDHALNYRTITKAVIQHVEEGRFLLLESLVNEVLQLVMREPKACYVEVEADKPHALRFSDSVSITLSAAR